MYTLVITWCTIALLDVSTRISVCFLLREGSSIPSENLSSIIVMPLPTIRVSSNEQGSSRARQSPDDDPPEDRSSGRMVECRDGRYDSVMIGYHEDLSMSQSGSNSRWLKADAEDFVGAPNVIVLIAWLRACSGASYIISV